MKRSKMHLCAYCRRLFLRKYLTKDHIPPQGIYGKEWSRGKRLPWVLCCQQCRLKQSKGDEALKTAIGMGVLRSPHIEHLLPEFDRSLEQNSWWRKELALAMKNGKEISLYGRVDAVSFQIDGEFAKELRDEFIRICIGVLFMDDPDWNSLDYHYHVSLSHEGQYERITELFFQLGGLLDHTCTVGQDIFSAKWGFTQEEKGGGIMVMSFYKGLFPIVFILPHGYKFSDGKTVDGNQ